jgi:hypothetical protein
MENDKTTTRFFMGIACFALTATAVTSVVNRSWFPLVVLGGVLLGLLALSVLWAIVFAPVLAVMGRFFRTRNGKRMNNGSEQGGGHVR